MQKLISHTNYWHEFYSNNPDPELLRAFIAEDPSLTKIFNFASVPDIFSTIENYPFDEKLYELSNISQAEIDHLYKLYVENKKISKWIEYLVNLFELVKQSIRFYEHYKKMGDLTTDELIKLTAFVFHKLFSIDESLIYENQKGEKFKVQKLGGKSPIAWHVYREIPGEVPKVVLEIHFRLKPSTQHITEYKNHLDTKSVFNFRNYRSLLDNITYGGFHTRKCAAAITPRKGCVSPPCYGR